MFSNARCNASLMSHSGVNSVERSPNRADYVKNRFFTRVFEGGGANSVDLGPIERDLRGGHILEGDIRGNGQHGSLQ